MLSIRIFSHYMHFVDTRCGVRVNLNCCEGVESFQQRLSVKYTRCGETCVHASSSLDATLISSIRRAHSDTETLTFFV